MERRELLTGVAGCGLSVLFGGVTIQQETANSTQTSNTISNSSEQDNDMGTPEANHDENGVEVRFERVHPDEVEGVGPEIHVDGQTVYVEGTLTHNSSGCGTVDLAHAGYEETQSRVDVLVVAADDKPEDADACPMDLATTGYRAEVTADGEFNRVAVSAHGVTGTNSASVSTN